MRTPLSAALRRLVMGAGVLVATGTVVSRSDAQDLRDQYHQAPRDTVTQDVYDGWKQFNLNCARCHGEDVLGTTIAPHLILSLKPDGPINTKEALPPGGLRRARPQGHAVVVRPRHGSGHHREDLLVCEGSQRRQDGAGKAGAKRRLRG